MSSFAQKQLEKYGWKKGKGLGKKEDGISSPIGVKRKQNLKGLGYEHGREYKYHWWEQLYDKAADNLHCVDNKQHGSVTIKQKSDKAKISAKQRREEESLFINSGVLQPDGKTRIVSSDAGADGVAAVPARDDRLRCGSQQVTQPVPALDSQHLHSACDGMTAHRGARHGVRMTAKLERLRRQEQQQGGDATGSSINATSISAAHPNVASGKRKRKRTTR